MLLPHHIEEDMQKMNDSMIGHGRGLQEELREHSKEYLEDGEDRHVFVLKNSEINLINMYPTQITIAQICMHIPFCLQALLKTCLITRTLQVLGTKVKTK